MRNAPSKVVAISGLVALTMLPIGLGVLSNKLEHKRNYEKKEKHIVWLKDMQKIKQEECSNSLHYIKEDGYFYHGNLIDGLGWSEEFCREYNRGAY